MDNEPRARPFVLQWRSAVLSSSLTATQKLCLLVLAEFADLDGSSCYPSHKEIGAKASLTTKSVQRSMDEAEPAGWISRGHRPTKDGWVYSYRLTVPSGVDTESTSTAPRVDTESTPEQGGGGLCVRHKWTLSPSRVDTESTDLSITYPIPRKDQKHVQSEFIAAVENRFDQFWRSYPRKVNRKGAEKVWKAKKLEAMAETILADVAARVADPGQWSDPKYIPHPTTYLNGARWEDEWTPTAAPLPVGTLPRETEAERINAASRLRLGMAA